MNRSPVRVRLSAQQIENGIASSEAMPFCLFPLAFPQLLVLEEQADGEVIAIPTPIEVAPVGAPRYRCAAPAELCREEWPAEGLGTLCHIAKASPLLEERGGEVGLVKLRPYALIAVATWWLLLCLPMKEGEKALGWEVLHSHICCIGTTAQGFDGGGFFGIAVEVAEEQAVRPFSTLRHQAIDLLSKARAAVAAVAS